MPDTTPPAPPGLAGPPVNLRNPVLAGVLAFLIPGLGHWYQGRRFKAVLYAVCILGCFFGGLSIGHGQVVYFHWQNPENRTYAYLCQFWTGLPALPALWQAKYRDPAVFEDNRLDRELNAVLTATLRGVEGELRGSIQIPPGTPGFGRGFSAPFEGQLRTPSGSVPVKGQLSTLMLDPQVGAGSRRRIRGYFDGAPTSGAPTSDNSGPLVGPIEGSVPRPLWDWYGAPLADTDGSPNSQLNQAHRALGSRFELGVVYTMIAGLLNVLAIFDALYGPAYGDEEVGPLGPPPGPNPTPGPTPSPGTAPATSTPVSPGGSA